MENQKGQDESFDVIVLLDNFRFLRKSQMKNIQFNDSMIKQTPK